MISLLESELSRSLLQAAKTKIGAPSPFHYRSRSWKPIVSRSVPEGSRPCSSQGGKPLGKEGAVNFPPGVGKGSNLSSARPGELHRAEQTVVRGYASEKSRHAPHSGDPGRRPSAPPHELSSDLSSDVQAFMQARPFEKIPGPTALHQSIPFAGTRLLYYPFTNYPAENMSNMLNKLQFTYGPIMRVKFGNEWVVIIEDLADIEKVVVAAEEEVSSQASSPEGNGLFDRLKKRVEDSALTWLGGTPQTQKLRADIARYLNTQLTVNSYLAKQEQVANELVNCLEYLQHNPKDMQTLFLRYSIESLTQMCFNRSVGLMKEPYEGDENKKKLVESYRTLVQCLGETMTGARVLHMLFEDPFAKRFKESKKVVNDWERCMIREITGDAPRGDKSAKSAKSPDGHSLLQTLLDDHSLVHDEICSAIHALMTIGSDSVSSTLQMMLYSLATNMDKQDKLCAEIEKVLGPEGRLDAKTLESMEYLKAAVKESLRINFPMAAGGRVTLSKNIVLHDYLIPAQTPIVVNSRRTAKNPMWFDHPHHYRPERWLGQESKKIPTLAFMPFGFGANHCPSRAFSLQELNVTIVKILQKYKVNIPGEYQHKPLDTVYTLFLSPKEPLPLYFIPRPPEKSKSGEKSKPSEQSKSKK